MLLSLLAIMVVLSASFLGFSQYQAESRRWQTYYAFGQQLALAAQGLHANVQEQAFDNGNVLAQSPFDGSNHVWSMAAIGSKLATNNLVVTSVGLDVTGFDAYAGLSPIGGAANDLAPSAYMVVRLQTVGTQGILSQRGRDLAAVKAGAVSKGLSAFGVMDSATIDPVLCRGIAASVRWSSDDYGCLNAADFALLGTTPNDGDIVIAAWQSQPKNLAANDVIYRYPQPANPTLNRMATNLFLDDNDADITDAYNIVNAGEVQTRTLATTAGATVGQNAGSQALTVSGATNMQAAVAVGGNMLIAGQLDVSGDFNLAAAADIGDSINVDNGNGVVTAQNVSAQTLGDNARNLTLQGPDVAGIPTATSVSINNDVEAATLWVGNNLNAAQAGTTVTANRLVTGQLDTTVFVADSVDVVGQLTTDNLSVAQSSQLPSATTTGECSGQACPDNVEENPGGGL